MRQHSLTESLRALDLSLAGSLTVVHADDEARKAESLAQSITGLGVSVVHATRAFDPQGIAEQNAIGLALKAMGIHLQLDDSYYAIKPGTILKGDGTPYRVYTPFFRAWFDQLRTQPQALQNGAKFARFASGEAPEPSKSAPFRVVAGEAFALRTLARFEARALDQYDELRDRADLSGTSHLSHALAFGEIHPRTILARLSDQSGQNVYRKEIAWREFYADVLWHNPASLTDYYEPRFARMRYDFGSLADARLAAWQQGKTGFPMVDAGMRQLLATGWMHNRVRMIVASFLVKDLHLEWQQGAEWFEQHLSDFDPASNSHGWQWTAGSGTDASPYFRVFNPISQGLKFDPNGDYVRKYVPELAHIQGAAVHEPWLLLDGLAHGYPAPIVDHAAEREEALARLAELKSLN
jgi:deoxyribodipyrimidine photo-lyase